MSCCSPGRSNMARREMKPYRYHRHPILSHLCQMWPLMPLVVMVLLSPLVAVLGGASDEICHLKTDGKYPKQAHYFYFDGENRPIIIEDSNRISHRIANRILKIILQNIAGYHEVKIQHCPGYDNQNITAILNRVSGRTYSSSCQPPMANPGVMPNTMVNLEAWMVAGFNKAPWLDTGQLVDAGPLGPQGRMGWFLPTATVERLWKVDKTVVDHWRALQVENITQKLSWWGKKRLDRVKQDHHLDYTVEAYRNPNPYCQQNHKGRRKCATLFAGYKGVDTGILQSQIEQLGLLVDIVWLEEHLDEFVTSLVKAGKDVLFFNWHPNTLLASGNFTRVSFPETHNYHRDGPQDCEFPVNQLTKVLWGQLKTSAPEASGGCPCTS